MDILSIGGIVLALASILVGQALEGGHASSLMQLTAGIIVVGGTIGAVAVAFPMPDFIRGIKMAGLIFGTRKDDTEDLIKQIVELASIARRDGVLALEQQVEKLQDPFLKKAVNFLVDGVDAAVARESLEAQVFHEYEQQAFAAKVWESAGGFAPTVGILGAVLGLIHVMENLSDPSKLGPGIAVAFVATVYGVGMANLFFLPMATKAKRKITVEKERKTLIAEGVLAIQAGLNPRVLEDKLNAFAGGHHAPKKEG